MIDRFLFSTSFVGFDLHLLDDSDAGLREKANKILASDYCTTTPEMKPPGDVAAAVGNYGASCQVQISEPTTVPSSMVPSEDVQVPIVPQVNVK